MGSLRGMGGDPNLEPRTLILETRMAANGAIVGRRMLHCEGALKLAELRGFDPCAENLFDASC